MTLRQLIILILLSTILLWGGWIWTLFVIDPDATNWLGFLFFYVIFFLAMTGTMALVGLFFRRKRGTDLLLHHLVHITFRQGMLLAALATSLLFLQGLRQLGVIALSVMFVVVVALELFLAWRFARKTRSFVPHHAPAPGQHIYAAASPGPSFNRKEIIDTPPEAPIEQEKTSDQ